MKCAITGANGYVGSLLVNALRQRGYVIYELRRDGAKFKSEFIVSYSLETKLDFAYLKNIDVLIHCAYDFHQTSWMEIHRVNVQGSLQLFEAARAARVKKVIMISTMSAYNGCKSMYGRAKYEIEMAANNLNADIVRPGLIFGASPGGFVGMLLKMIDRFPVAPIFGDGEQKLYLTHETDLSLLIHELTLNPMKRGVISAVYQDAMTYKSIMKKLAQQKNKNLFLIHVPWHLVHAGIKGLEVLGLSMGLRSDSLISLLNQNPNPDFEAMRKVGVSFRPF